jgi:hypothetical protein
MKSGKRVRWIIGTVVVFVAALYGLGQLAARFDKGATDVVQMAAGFAIGLRKPADGYEFPKEGTFIDKPTCDTSYKEGDSYYRCVALGRFARHEGCALWRFESCLVLEADSYLLSRPDLLGKTLDAIHRPCRYLPSEEQIATNEKIKPSSKTDFRRLLDEAGCETGLNRDVRKVIVNFYDAEDTIVARYVKAADFERCSEAGGSPLSLYLFGYCGAME